VYLAQGKYDQAAALLQEVVQARTAQLGVGHPGTLLSKNDLATVYRAQGKYDKAEPLLREAADGAKQQTGGDSPPYAGQLALLGVNLLQQKKYPEAEKVMRDCLSIREKSEPDGWSTFNTRSMLGGALLGQKKYPEAEPLLLQGYDGMKQRRDKIPPPGLVRLPEALERLVQLYDAWGKKDQADRWRKELEATRAKP
jgi:tetratricopeptide (TPR) repeat protein